MQHAARAWLQSDPSAALEWVNAVDEASVKRIVIRQHVENLLASNDPASAVVWLDRISEPSREMPSSVEWAKPGAGLKDKLPGNGPHLWLEGETREIAIQSILSSWAEQRPVEAATAAVNQFLLRNSPMECSLCSCLDAERSGCRGFSGLSCFLNRRSAKRPRRMSSATGRCRTLSQPGNGWQDFLPEGRGMPAS